MKRSPCLRWVAAAALTLAFAGDGPARPPGLEDALRDKVAGKHTEAEARLRELAMTHPDDAEVLLHLGIVQGWLGRHTEALTTFDRALQLRPSDPELRLGRGRILAWMGRLEAAEGEFRNLLAGRADAIEVRNMLGRVLAWQRRFESADEIYAGILAEAPGDTDALVGRGDLQRMQGRLDEARVLYERALAAEPAAAEIAQRLADIRGAGAWRRDAGIEFSGFDDPTREDWRGAHASLRHAWNRRTGLGLQVEWADRYGARDLQYFAAADHRPSDAWTLALRLGLTPAADFLARRQVDASVSWRFRDGTERWPASQLVTDVRIADYGAASARSIWAGVAQRLPGRLTLTARGLVARNLNGEETGGWQLRLAGEPREEWRWSVGYSDAGESFTPSIFELSRKLRTRAAFGGVQHDLSLLHSVRIDGIVERIERGPTRRGLHVGLTTRF